MSERDPIGTQVRFQMLLDADFTCRFCGARPGNDQLNIAHIYPHSRGGTAHANNLVVACRRCNNGMGTNVAVPLAMCTSERDPGGWYVWKRWGAWTLAWIPQRPKSDERGALCSDADIAVCYAPLREHPNHGSYGSGSYHWHLSRIHEDWEDHIGRKRWPSQDMLDLDDALAFCRTLVVQRRPRASTASTADVARRAEQGRANAERVLGAHDAMTSLGLDWVALPQPMSEEELDRRAKLCAEKMLRSLVAPRFEVRTRDDLRALVRESRRVMSRAISMLLADGRIRRDEDGCYRVVP